MPCDFLNEQKIQKLSNDMLHSIATEGHMSLMISVYVLLWFIP